MQNPLNLLTSSMACIPMNKTIVDKIKLVASFISMPFSQRDDPMMLYTFHHSV